MLNINLGNDFNYSLSQQGTGEGTQGPICGMESWVYYIFLLGAKLDLLFNKLP